MALIIVFSSSGSGDGDKGGTAKASQPKKAARRRNRRSRNRGGPNATPQADWKPYTGPVPILEYHVLGKPPEGAPYPELYVGRTDFEKQMDWLEERATRR